VHGNVSVKNTAINAARCLEAFAAPQDILVYPGASKPLIRQTLPAPVVHGDDGVGGVEGLPGADNQRVLARIVLASKSTAIPALDGIKIGATRAFQSGKKLYLGVTGAAKNTAIFLLAYPQLAKDAIQQIIMMGGGIGLGK